MTSSHAKKNKNKKQQQQQTQRGCEMNQLEMTNVYKTFSLNKMINK
jgi:hypothetical protein